MDKKVKSNEFNNLNRAISIKSMWSQLGGHWLTAAAVVHIHWLPPLLLLVNRSPWRAIRHNRSRRRCCCCSSCAMCAIAILSIFCYLLHCIAFPLYTSVFFGHFQANFLFRSLFLTCLSNWPLEENTVMICVPDGGMFGGWFPPLCCFRFFCCSCRIAMKMPFPLLTSPSDTFICGIAHWLWEMCVVRRSDAALCCSSLKTEKTDVNQKKMSHSNVCWI